MPWFPWELFPGIWREGVEPGPLYISSFSLQQDPGPLRFFDRVLRTFKSLYSSRFLTEY